MLGSIVVKIVKSTTLAFRRYNVQKKFLLGGSWIREGVLPLSIPKTAILKRFLMKKLLPFFLLPFLFGSFTSSPTKEALPVQRPGKDYAVFFYVTRFQPGWQGLPDTKTETEALGTELDTSYGFKVKLVPNPSKQQIYDEIAAWNERLSPDDQVLFFFSMHGYYDPGSELGYLIAADGLYRDDYYQTWLDYNSLRPYFARCKAKHILVALDACYSGSFGDLERAPDHPVYEEGLDCQTQIAASFK